MTAIRPTRRRLLAGAAAVLAASDRALAREIASAFNTSREDAQRTAEATPLPSPAAPAPAAPNTRDSLWLRRLSGGDIALRFRGADSYEEAAVARLSWFLRDTTDRDRAVWMEPRLFDLLAGLQAGLSAVNGAPVPLVVTSAYRTPEHNAAIETAARNSMHMYGCAVDVHVPPFSPRAVALAASFMKGGGIGLYDGFTHLDVGVVRSWVGRPRRLSPGIGAG